MVAATIVAGPMPGTRIGRAAGACCATAGPVPRRLAAARPVARGAIPAGAVPRANRAVGLWAALAARWIPEAGLTRADVAAAVAVEVAGLGISPRPQR
jgi:hypothetical protein